ncbi:GNAT family N-acetyltransferase [Streptomyces rimosus]
MFSANAREPGHNCDCAIITPRRRGRISITRLATDPHQQKAATMGFALRPDSWKWKVGYGRETVRLTLDLAYTDLGLHREWAARAPRNEAPAKTRFAAGMVEEGRIRGHVYVREAWRDSITYGILRDEWAAQNEPGRRALRAACPIGLTRDALTVTAPLTVQRHRRIIDVHLLLIRDGQVLLSLRQGGYASGQWQVPSGHLEADEPTDHGTVRGGWEEIGVRVDPGHLELAHVIDHRAPGEDPRFGIFYRAHSWDGEPYNAEPDKCGGLSWFPFDGIPEQTVPYHAAALCHIATGRISSKYGWDLGL